MPTVPSGEEERGGLSGSRIRQSVSAVIGYSDEMRRQGNQMVKGIVNLVATREPELSAGAPLNRASPPHHQDRNIKPDKKHLYTDTQDRINANWPPNESAKKTARDKDESKN